MEQMYTGLGTDYSHSNQSAFFSRLLIRVENKCLPSDAWQRVSGEEGKGRFVSLYEPYGVLTTLLGVEEHSHVQAAGTLTPPQPRT